MNTEQDVSKQSKMGYTLYSMPLTFPLVKSMYSPQILSLCNQVVIMSEVAEKMMSEQESVKCEYQYSFMGV